MGKKKKIDKTNDKTVKSVNNGIVRKTISSAVANAENNFQYDIDKLIVKEAYCGKKIVMKRFRPRAKGRAAPILKPWSTVTIILSEAKQMEKHGAKS
jgi:large subunit ribosomal protein L22